MVNNFTLAALETLLVIKFRPTFLALQYQSDYDTIEVVMSSAQFNYLSLNDRVISVFNEISKEMPTLMEETLIVVQPFNSVEIDQVLNDVFESQIK